MGKRYQKGNDRGNVEPIGWTYKIHTEERRGQKEKMG
jgi:hypothetical protein